MSSPAWKAGTKTVAVVVRWPSDRGGGSDRGASGAAAVAASGISIGNIAALSLKGSFVEGEREAAEILFIERVVGGLRTRRDRGSSGLAPRAGDIGAVQCGTEVALGGKESAIAAVKTSKKDTATESSSAEFCSQRRTS